VPTLRTLDITIHLAQVTAARVARLNCVTRCEDIVRSGGMPPSNSMQRTALGAAADAERQAKQSICHLSRWSSSSSQ